MTAKPASQFSSIPNRVWHASSIVFGAEWHQDKLLRARVGRAAKHYARNLLSLERGATRPQRWIRGKVRHIATSRSARLICTILAAAKQARKMPPAKAAEIALELNFYNPSLEKVTVRLVPKSKGGHRQIVMSGQRRTVYQWFIRDILSALRPTPATEYAARGKGRDMAIKETIAQINDEGKPFTVVADVEDCFGSIGWEGATKIVALPKSLLKNCLFIEEGAEIRIKGTTLYMNDEELDDVKEHIRSGLPQGSLASSLFASLVVAELMEAVPVKSRGKSYVDDIVAIASDHGEAEAIKKALEQRALAIPTGPLSFKRLESRKIARHGLKPIELLGYALRVNFLGKARATPTPAKICGFMKRLRAALREVPFDNVAALATKRAIQWRKSQSAWDLTPGSLDLFSIELGAEINDAEKWHIHMKLYGNSPFAKDY